MRLLLFGIAWLFYAQAATAATTAEIVARYVEWRGGTEFEKVSALREIGTTMGLGTTGRYERIATDAGLSRRDTDFGQLRETTVTGPAPWRSLNSRAGEYDSAQEAQDRRVTMIEFASWLDRLKGEMQPPEVMTVEGQDWFALRVPSAGNEERLDLLVDGATGAAHGILVRQGELSKLYRWSNWHSVQGVRVPFVREWVDPTGEATGRVDVASVILNPPVPQALLQKPQLRPAAGFTDGRTTTGFMPFRFVHDRHLYLEATVNGSFTEVLLDSGAAWTVLDKSFAERIGVNGFGSRTTRGTGGVAPSQYAAGVDIRIGNLVLNDLLVLIMDLSDVSARLGVPLPVVLGSDAFEKLIVDMDFEHRRIAFSEREGYAPPAGAVRVPFPSVEGVRAIHVSVEGEPPLPMVFDIGNGSVAINLFPSFQRRRDLLADGRPSSTSMSGAIGGAVIRKTVMLQSLRVAGIEFRDVPAQLNGEGKGASSSTAFYGNIGMAILGRFRFITDYLGDTLWALPIEEAVDRPFDKDRTGLVVVNEADRLLVSYVAPDSPAARAGIEAGDRILAVNGQVVTPDQAGSAVRWKYGPAGSVLRLRMEDGRDEHLILGDYY